MEHGWCPTNSPGRTPIQIPGVLLFCVISPRRPYWPISQSRILGDFSFVEKPINNGLFERAHGCPTRWAGRTPPYSITLWWLVRVRPAPPPSRLQPENPVIYTCRPLARSIRAHRRLAQQVTLFAKADGSSCDC